MHVQMRAPMFFPLWIRQAFRPFYRIKTCKAQQAKLKFALDGGIKKNTSEVKANKQIPL